MTRTETYYRERVALAIEGLLLWPAGHEQFSLDFARGAAFVLALLRNEHFETRIDYRAPRKKRLAVQAGRAGAR